MASSVYQVGTVAKLGETFNSTIGNTALGSTAVTSLSSDVYYAYKDGYTYNGLGSQQGTGLGYRVKVIFRLGQPNLTNRTVPLYAAAYFCRTDGYSSNNDLYLNMTANTDKASFSQLCAISPTWLKTITLTSTLTYNDDGTLPITIDLTGSNSTGTCSKIVCKFSINAPKIEEKSAAITVSLSATDLTLGTTECTITHNKPLGKDYCTDILLYFKDNDVVTHREYLFTKNTQDVVKFTPAHSIATKIANATSHVAYVNVRTFSTKDTSTMIGQKNFTVKLLVPSSDKYKITSVEAGSTGAAYTIGVDKPQAILKIDDSKAYGATIEKIEVKFTGETVTFNANQIPAAVDGKITLTGTKPFTTSNQSITVTLTDSRGRIVTKSTTFDTEELSSVPNIKTLNVGRGIGDTLSNWVNNDEGKNCLVKYTVKSNKVIADVAAGKPGNKINITVQYKKASDPTFTTFTYSTPDNDDGNVSDTFIIPIEDALNAYTIRITANDGYATIYRETNLSIGYILAEIHESGKGISLGTKCDQEGFLVNMTTTFKQPVYNAAGSVAITSDESRKSNIVPLSEMFSESDLVSIFEQIDPISYMYKFVEGDKTHMGFSANKIHEVLSLLDKNVDDLSVVDTVTERVRVVDDNRRDTWEESTIFTLKYEELIPLMWLMIKKLSAELKSIKENK